MKTDYFGHEALYKKFKEEGKRGWSPDEEVQITLTQLEEFLRTEYTPKRGKLLEMGCGDGTFSLWFARKGFDVYGIDISPTAIEWAKEKATKQDSSADFRVGSVLNLKNFTNNFFNLIFDGHCFHCIIGNDRQLFLESVLRVLKPGGIFRVCTMCGEVTSNEIKDYFDTDTHCYVVKGIARRHIGLPEDILSEIKGVGFNILHSKIHPRRDEEDQDELLADVTKLE